MNDISHSVTCCYNYNAIQVPGKFYGQFSRVKKACAGYGIIVSKHLQEILDTLPIQTEQEYRSILVQIRDLALKYPNEHLIVFDYGSDSCTHEWGPLCWQSEGMTGMCVLCGFIDTDEGTGFF